VTSPERWQRLNDLFHDAAALDPARRPSFLDAACGGDAELRAEVDRLLRAHDVADAFLATRTVADEGGAGSEDESSVAGRRVGPYVLVREVGRGGMGAVYLAERADEQFQKRVAIKLIKRGMDTDALLRQFRSERQILASLDHPHIARLLDGGTTDDGRPYFVMEHIEGVRIDAYCDAHRLPVPARLALFRQVCSAVSYAHQQLVVHRDIKPSNILVTSDGTPKLLDFGIARILHGDGEPDAATQTGVRLVTPEYASLEQLQGRRATALSDVYSLGVVLYELLCGSRPYQFPSREPAEVARAIATTEPARPSDAARRSVESDLRGEGAARLSRRLRGDLDTIVLTAIRREPERRYPSVERFSEDIARHLEGRPVLAREDTFAYRTRKFVQRNRVPVAAALLVFLSLAGGMAATLWQARKARAQEAIARAEQARAERRFNDVRALARSMLFDYHDAIKDLPGATPVRARLVQDALSYLDALSREAGGDRALQAELAAAYERVGEVQGGSTSANLGDTTGAIASLRKALELRESVRAADPGSREARRALGTGYARLGKLVWETGELADALATVRTGLVHLEALAREGPADAASRLELGQAQDLTGFMLQEQGEHAASLEHLRRARATLETLPVDGPEGPKVRRALSAAWEHEGTTLFVMGDLPRALATYRRALDLRLALSAEFPNNADYRRITGITHYNIADALHRMGRLRESLGAYRESLAIVERLAASDPANEQYTSDLPYSILRVGELLAALGERTPALAQFQRARALREREVAADPTNLWKRAALIEVHAKLAKTLAGAGRPADALAATATTQALMEKTTVEPTNVAYRSFFAGTYQELGEAHAAMTRWREARGMYQRSLEIWQDMRARGIMGKIDEGKPGEIAKAIADCERRMASR
jgi:non-specific serine/threonine protein kinase/serine/threonine-protein kinase